MIKYNCDDYDLVIKDGRAQWLAHRDIKAVKAYAVYRQTESNKQYKLLLLKMKIRQKT